jgi:cyclic di-GMP phosphodiesterase
VVELSQIDVATYARRAGQSLHMTASHSAGTPEKSFRNAGSRSTLSSARVLIVDDESSSRKVLAIMLEQEGLFCKTGAGAAEALEILDREHFNAIIADLQMPGFSGLQLLAEVRRRFPEMAFLLGTGVDDVRVGVQAMREGADDYLVKPFQCDVVLACLDRAFRKKRLEREVENYRHHLEKMVADQTQQLRAAFRQIESSYSNTLAALGAAIDLRDSPTAGHSHRVFLYSTEVARALNLTEHQLTIIGFGALLHDIGKLAIPDGILLKPGPLTAEEHAVMQKHAQLGYEMVKGIEFLAEPAEIILTHHERCDGSGYPRGLRAEDIPIGAKIFAVADTVDAMTSDRPYRAALPLPAAQQQIRCGSGKLYDPRIVEVFLSISNEIWESIRAETRTTLVGPVLASALAGAKT